MKHFKAIALSIMFVSVVTPLFAFAQAPAKGSDGGLGGNQAEKKQFQIVPCDNVTVECDFNMLLVGINRVMKFLLFLSIPLVMGMGLYTAYKFMTAGGDAGKLADAKKMFVPVALGLFWILAAYIVVYTFLDKLVSEKFREEAKESINIFDNRK